MDRKGIASSTVRSSTRSKVPQSQKTTTSPKKASADIHEIFKHGTSSKKQRVKSAIIIQKHFRGWLQRHYKKVAKQKALRRSTNFKIFLDKYREHCQEIMKRHDQSKQEVKIDFYHVNEYIEKLLKFEVTFQMMVSKDDQHIPFQEFRNYYTKCNLHPSAKEIEDAATAICEDRATITDHLFTKREVVDISLHIYVPKGTQMVVRKSTWLHPIVDGKEASSIKLSKTDCLKTTLQKTLDVVGDAKKKREEHKEELIDKYTGKEAGKLGMLLFEVQPGSSKTKGKVTKSKSVRKRT